MRKIYLWLLSVLIASFSFAQSTLIDPNGDGGFETGTDFAANGWTVVNGSQLTKWFVGTAAAGYSGSRAAYVSGDNGTTNGNIQTSSAVFFYRDVTFPAGQNSIILSFDYKQATLDATYDYTKVFLVPTSTTITPGTVLSTGQLGVEYPTVANASFTTYMVTVPASAAGTTQRLVFMWKNDGVTPHGFGAIDNISLKTRFGVSIQSTGVGGVWSAAATWVGGNIPGISDTANISTGATVTIDISPTVNRTVVNGTLDFNSTSTNTLTTGDLVVNAGGTFNAFNGTAGRTVNINGNLVNNGTVDFTKSSAVVSMDAPTPAAATSIGGTGTFTAGIIRLLTINNASGVTLNVPLVVPFSLNLAAGVFTIGSNLTLDNTLNNGVATTVVQTQRSPASSYSTMPTIGGSAVYNVIYYNPFAVAGAITTGNEIPATRTINALTINVANGVSLTDDLTVTAASSALTLTSGILTVPPGKTLMFTNASYAGTAGIARSFVNGAVALIWGASGTRSYPVGSNGVLRKAVFASAIGTSGFVRVQILSSGQGTPGTGLTALSPTRRWYADVMSGTITSYATVALDYGADDAFPTSNTNRKIGQSATLAGAYNSIGPGITNSSAPITSSLGTRTTLGYFALGLSSGSFAMVFTNAAANNQWGDPANWSTNVVPTSADDAFIPAGNTANLTGGAGTYFARTLVTGGTLVSNTAGNILTIGATGLNNSQFQNDGTLTISNGTIRVNGSVVMGTASSTVAAFNISGGLLEIAGNDGTAAANSVPTGVPMLGLGYSTSGISTSSLGLTINGTGGTIRIIDHNYNAASTAGALLISIISSNKNTTSLAGTTVEFGNGTSALAGQTQGFVFDTYVSNKRVRLGNIIVNTRTDLNASRFVQTTSSIGDGADIERNVTINTGSELRAMSGRCDLAVGGDIINNGTLTTSGTLLLGGNTSGSTSAISNPSSISGSGVFQNNTVGSTGSFADMTVNNAGGVTLNVPVTVTGTLTLTNGVVNSSATNLLSHGVFTGTVGTGTLERTNGYVVGPFRRVVPATAYTPFDPPTLFAVGNATNYRPAEINFTVAPTAVGSLTAQWINGDPGTNGLPLTEGAITVSKVSPDGYWRVSAGDGLTGGTYMGTFTANNINGIVNPTQLVLLKRNEAPASPWTLNGTHVLTTGNSTSAVLSRTGMVGFSEFGIGSSNLNTLPVLFSSIKAFQQNSGVAVNWNVATEQNLARYEVEKSIDGRKFTTTGSVLARNATNYSWYDAAPFAGNNYYRVRAVKRDGSALYTSIAKVYMGKGAAAIAVYPNPVEGDVLNLQFINLSKGNYTINISNQVGQKVFSQVISHGGGSANQFININNKLVAGIYQLQVIGQDVQYAQTIMRQ